jgi:phosphohistidine phosphatase SixA
MNKLMKMFRPLPLGLVALLTALTLPGAAQAETLSGTALVQALRQGGYVLLMRHASSPHDVPDKVKPERQLDQTGRDTAMAMGAAMKKLGVPVGDVLSSPTYRALETVKLAGFGTAKTYEELGDGGASMSAQAVAGWASWLKMRVSKKPRVGTNTILVTHSPNIAAAFPGEAKGLSDGEALVFLPESTGAVLVARVKIEEWPRLAQGALPVQRSGNGDK